MLNATDLKEYLGAKDDRMPYVQSCLVAADMLVMNFVGTANVPVEILERATLEVGSELYHRRYAPNGVSQYTTTDGAIVRRPRDPMVGAYPLLSPYLGFGVA
jgi:hypothetical protein